MYLKEKTDQKPASPRYVLILPSQPLHVMIQLPVNKRGSRWNGGSQWLTVNGNSQHNEMNFSSCKTQIFRIQQPAQEKGTYYKKQPLYSHSKKFCPGNFFQLSFLPPNNRWNPFSRVQFSTLTPVIYNHSWHKNILSPTNEMQFTDRKTHFTDCIPLLLIPNYKVRTDRHMAYTYRYGAGVLDNPQTSAFGLFKKISNCKFRMKRVDFFFPASPQQSPSSPRSQYQVRPVLNVVLMPCRTQLIELNSTLAQQ